MTDTTVAGTGRNQPGLLPVLTCMRGVAALMILALHALTWTTPASLEHSALRNFLPALRFVAMPLFFVLSGWVIHYNFARYLGQARNYPGFIAKRLLRLYPLYAACLVVLYGFNPPPDLPPLDSPVTWRYLTLTHSWTYLTLRGIPVTQSFFTISWSISTELALYLAYPLLGVLACRLRSERTVVWALIGTFAAAATTVALVVTFGVQVARALVPEPAVSEVSSVVDWFLHVSPWMRMWDFAIGVLLAQFVAVARDGSIERLSRSRAHGISIVLLAGVFLIATYDDIAWRTAFTGGLYQSCAFTPFIALMLLTGFYRPGAYGRSLLLPVGIVSYSIYLGHYVVYVILVRTKWLQPQFDSWQGWLLQVAIPVAITCVFAVVAYRLVEQPFIRLGRKIVLTRPLTDRADP